MFDERPIVLLVHATSELINAGYPMYPDGREAIIHCLRSLESLLLLGDLNRIDHEDLESFLRYAASRVNYDLRHESEAEP